jgi:hypothetical protein
LINQKLTTSIRSWFAIGAGIAAIVGALRYVAGDESPWMAMALLALAMAFLAVVMRRSSLIVFEAGDRPEPDIRPHVVASRAPFLLLPPGTLATIVAADRMHDAQRAPAGWNVAIPWLLGIGLFALAAWWPQAGFRRILTTRRWRPPVSWSAIRALAPWVGMLAIAAVPRLLWLDRFPTVIDGDEGMYMRAALEARTGAMINPFATGWFGIPNLFPAAQGWLTDLIGTDPEAHRVLSTLAGIAGVLGTWRFGRRVVGSMPAAIGAIVQATLPFHLYFSRTALNHITDPTSLILALLFLWRGIEKQQRQDAFLSGVFVGLGWYGYWGARIYPVILALLILIAATDVRTGFRQAIRLGSWCAAGFLVTAAPLLMWFVVVPEEFRSRTTIVSYLSMDNLREDPSGVLRLFLANVRESLLFPLVDNTDLFFRHAAPFVGWAVAVPIVVGIAAWIARIVHDRSARTAFWLLVPWIVLVLGVATTTPVQSQRFVAMIPFWCLAAGSGIAVLARWVTAIGMPRPATAARGMTVVALLALSVIHLDWMASEDRQFTTFGDIRTTSAWDIGWRLSHSDTGNGSEPAIVFAGPPFMFINSWGNLKVLAPNAVLTDLDRPLETMADVPPIPPGTMLILVPERSSELCMIVRADPTATVAEARARDGTLLYTAFFHGPLPGWSTASTPAETSFDVIDGALCESEQASRTRGDERG